MEPISSLLIPAITETVFGALAEATGLSEWLRQRLGRDPERLAFQSALTQALTIAAHSFPGRDLRYFTEILRDVGGPLLARTLQPGASWPTPEELTQLWLNHLTIDSAIHYRQEFAAFATLLLDQLNQHIENQQPLQWIVQARRLRSTEEAIRRLAEAAEQGSATLDVLQQELVKLTDAMESVLKIGGSAVSTAGGAYVTGSVNAHNFAGHDLTIKNYFVAGLPRLVIDYSSRIQDFLLEYLGSKRKRVPFGGRQQQLEELHAWLDDPMSPPYYLMSAEAGRGKSALVCRWLAQLTTRPALDVIFVPISLRFETATQDVVFAALAARLANLYESEPEKLPPASLTAEQWKGVCQSYLRRSPPEGKQLLVILDGLDEATGWTPSRGLFSSDPPDGIRILVTARTRPSESSRGWANSLGWDNSQLVCTATLPGLDRQEVEEALVSMGNPLNKLATKVDMVGELHRLSEGDPLLVRLYVDALVAQGQKVATLCDQDLQQIKPGLGGYFERWWQDQREQWRRQGRNPITEQAHLRLLLNAIAASLGPLTLDDLAALHSDLADSSLLHELLEYVSRWLVGDGKAQGYSYSHPRLSYYFWEQLGSQEQRTWNERFTAWGERILTVLNSDEFASDVVPIYLLQHYAIHLDRYSAPPKSFYVLLSRGWQKAWANLDISNIGFLNDVSRVWDHAYDAYDPAKSGRAEALVCQIKAAFCRSSIATLGSNLSPELLCLTIKYGLRTPTQALMIAKLTLDEAQRAKALVAVTPHLSQDLLEEVLIAVRTITNHIARVDALSRIVPYLPDPQRIKILEEILFATRALTNYDFYVAVLSRLVPYLLEKQRIKVLREGLDITQAITNDSDRGHALSLLAPFLPLELTTRALMIARSIKRAFGRACALNALALYLPDQHELLFEALVAARELKSGTQHALTLIKLLPHLPEYQHNQVLKEILRSIETVKDKSFYVSIISEFNQQLSPNLYNSVLTNLLVYLESIQDASSKAWILSKIASRLPEKLQSQARSDSLAYARTTKDKTTYISVLFELHYQLPKRQAKEAVAEALEMAQEIGCKPWPLGTLVKLVPYLTGELLDQALSTVCTIKDEEYRMSVLCDLAPYLSDHLLTKTMILTSEIEDEESRASVLCSLAPHLPEHLLTEALTIARAIEDEESRASVLCSLAPHLPEYLLTETMILTSEIEDEESRASVLCSLAPHLSEHLLTEALTIACAIKNKKARISALSGLAPHLPEHLLTEALTIACAIKDEEYRSSMLCNLAPHLLGNQRNTALIEALAIDHELTNEYHLSDILSDLAPHLPEHLLTEALTIACAIKDEESRASVLSSLAPHLSEHLLTEALTIARAIKNKKARISALSDLAPHLPEHLLTEALTIACAIEDDYHFTLALSSLAPHLPEHLLTEALTIACAIEGEQDRISVLIGLAPHLPVHLLTETLALTRTIKDEYHLSSILRGLVSYLPEHLLTEVLTLVRTIKGEQYRASALGSLIPYLPKHLLAQALTTACAIENEQYRVFALNGLAPHLPEDLLAETLITACAIREEKYRASVLGGLIPHLPEHLLIQALTAIQTIDEEFHTLALRAFTPEEVVWKLSSPDRLYTFFATTLRALSHLPRHAFQQDLAALMPFILGLAGDEAPQAAEGIFHAIQDVCGWWP